MASDRPISKVFPEVVLALIVVTIAATIVSIILTFILRDTVGREIVLLILFPVDIRIPFPINLCGILLVFFGFLLIIWANYTLLFVGRIGVEAREPFHVPDTLVIEGPYRFSRNPIYLSVIIMALGAAIMMGSLTIFILSVVLFLIFQTWFISWEEKKLEEAFGEEYLEFKKRVRRWI
ncbi:MAG: methyltransferase family protein [Candidatus Hodarchaeales archaeon]|jgi:protein-S-isoprenylcysteine O-methyltransferase Ste14